MTIAEPVIHHAIFYILTEIPSCSCALLAFKDFIILRILLLSNLIEVGLAAECIVTKITEIVTEIMNVL